MRNIFLQKSCRRCSKETSSRSFKVLFSICFDSPQHGHIIKTKCMNTVKTSRDMLKFGFSKEGLGLVSPPHFVHDSSRKIFLVIFYSWHNFILWLALHLKISGKLCIVIGCYLTCDVINVEIYLSFLIKPFSCLPKNSEQKLNISRQKEIFKAK